MKRTNCTVYYSLYFIVYGMFMCMSFVEFEHEKKRENIKAWVLCGKQHVSGPKWLEFRFFVVICALHTCVHIFTLFLFISINKCVLFLVSFRSNRLWSDACVLVCKRDSSSIQLDPRAQIWSHSQKLYYFILCDVEIFFIWILADCVHVRCKNIFV